MNLLCCPVIMRRKRLSDLLSNAVQRIKAGHGVLKNDAHLSAAQTAQLLGTLAQKFFPLKLCTALDMEAVVQQTHRRFHRH